MTHHARDEYGQILVQGTLSKGPTGKRERSGWKGLGDSADMIVHAYLKDEKLLGTDGKPTGKTKKMPYGRVDLAEILDLVGMEIQEPTYEKIKTVLEMMRG
jgi:hypothetical protein